MELKLAQAEKMIRAAKDKAREMGLNMSFVVTDATGLIVAAARMDRARKFGTKVAHGKTLATVAFSRPSADTAAVAKERPLIVEAFADVVGGKLFCGEGALPVVVDGQLIGAIGGSGGTSAEDLVCAQAGLDAVFGKARKK